MKKELITAYSKDKDMTFILEESYNGNELASTECIRWHYGCPTEEDTKDNSRDLVAKYFNHGIEVIYTGGGIWLACKNLDTNHYAIVGDDFEEGIAIYDRRGETPYKDDEWPCQNMVECYTDDELKSSNMWDLFKIYKDMLTQLHEERW